ncbi:MAG TPA: hypothetical protein VGE40_08985, partial [Bacilli bacterium]
MRAILMKKKLVVTFVFTFFLSLTIFGTVFADSINYTGIESASRTDSYNYGPTVMIDGATTKMWWCAHNPNHHSAWDGDSIWYSSKTTDGGTWSTAQMVMEVSASGWDSLDICDPSVVKGAFAYNGHTYAYAMYYSAADAAVGPSNTQIGVAFSDNGTTWVKYAANPIITYAYFVTGGYGVGMQTAYNSNLSGSNITLAYFDATGSSAQPSFVVTSTDGINFNIGGRQTLPAPVAGVSIGDIAYSPTEGIWY